MKNLTLPCVTLNGHAYAHTFHYPDARNDYARLIALFEPYGAPEWGEDDDGRLLARANGLPDGHACHVSIERAGALVTYVMTYATMEGEWETCEHSAREAAEWLARMASWRAE